MADFSTCFPDSDLQFRDDYQDLFDSFYQNGIMSADLLTMSKEEIVNASGRSIVQIKKFLHDFEQQANTLRLKKPLSGFESRRKQCEMIQFDVPIVSETTHDPDDPLFQPISERNDKLINMLGGLPLGSITEVVGQSAVGKSHFLMQLSATVQMRHTKRKALYISTEKTGLATSRLSRIVQRTNRDFQALQLAIHEKNKTLNPSDSPNNTPNLRSISTDNIFTFKATDGVELLHVLQYQVPILIKRFDIGLLIIDSIAGPYRGLDVRQNNNNKSLNDDEKANVDSFVETLDTIRSIARNQHIAVALANQVKDRILSSFSDRHIPETLPHQIQNDYNFNTLESRSTDGEIHSLIADNQIRWYSGWTNLFLATKNFRQETIRPKLDLENENFESPSYSQSSHGTKRKIQDEEEDAIISAETVRRCKLKSFYNLSDPNTKNKHFGKSPSLGLYLAHLVDQRIVLKREHTGRRYFQVVFSPWCSGQKPILEPFDDANKPTRKTNKSWFEKATQEINSFMVDDSGVDPTKEVVEYQIYNGGIQAV